MTPTPDALSAHPAVSAVLPTAPRPGHCLVLARRALVTGGVIAYPTEAVYGLGCLPEVASAVARILLMKRRPRGKKGLILVAASIDQLLHYLARDAVPDWDTVLQSWPGPVSWVFPASRALPVHLQGAGNSIAVRVSAHPVVRALCLANGPLVSTSANPSGRLPARSKARVRRYFGHRIDYVYPGHTSESASVSELRCARSQRVLRAAMPVPAPVW